jgi:hypothetical protein
MANGIAANAAQAEAGERKHARTDSQAALVGPFGRTILGTLMFVLGVVLLYMMIALWPAVQAAAKSGGTAKVTWFGHQWRPTADAALLALVVLSSGLGSYVHAAVSFADYVGNRGFVVSWVWWYLLRVFVGSSLAVIFYFAIRGGFLGAGTNAADINVYGIAAISALVGLFSKQATDKLREVFDTAFRVGKGGDKERGDGMSATPGAIESEATPAATKTK